MLPKGVHKVVSRGREYFYFQSGRGTSQAGERVRLPSDPHSPEFWAAIRQAQGLPAISATNTVGGLIDAYLKSPAVTRLAESTQYQYRRHLEIARKAWGALSSAGVRPVHVQAVMDNLSATPAKANNFLGAMRAMSVWARARDHIPHSLTEGVKPFGMDGGHEPWGPEQIKCVHDKLTGVVRQGVMLMLYTGQRGSDVVRLGWTDINDESLLRVKRQQKTGVEAWCPIVPELAAEMQTWKRRPGPFLQENGKVLNRKRFWDLFDKARAGLPELQGFTPHGLRATAVIRLRRAGLTPLQIQDIVGMSVAMIERYCRFADRKESGKAALVSLERTRQERGL